MIAYPTTLPCPTVRATQKGGDTFIRSEFGFSMRQRALPTSTYTLSAMIFITSKEQMHEFKDFYHKSLVGGVRKFTADWDIEGSSVDKTFRFSEIYEVLPRGAGLYEVSAKFDMLTNIKDI